MALNKNRVKCWICGQWQAEKYTEQAYFNGLPETICLKCLGKLEEREESLEIAALYAEDHKDQDDEASN